MTATVSATIVSFSDPEASCRAIQSLLAQSVPPIEILVIDNHPNAIMAARLAGSQPDERVRLIHSGENLGYTRACNCAASAAKGAWLFFLNPDAVAEPDCLQILLAAAYPEVGALGAQVLLPEGRTNAGDNPVHVSGLAWSGAYQQAREDGPPRSVAAVSGAALLVRRDAYDAVGGMCDRFFLYYDDTDICWRLRLAGWDVVFCPRAAVVHDYEFDKGSEKWFWLERNRLWSVLANYSIPTLILLAPMLLLTELVVLLFALRAGWLRSWARARASILGSLPELRRWRHAVQAYRRRQDSALLELMVGRFDTKAVQSHIARSAGPLMDAYRLGVGRLLRCIGA